jgi:hypothetical protein
MVFILMDKFTVNEEHKHAITKEIGKWWRANHLDMYDIFYDDTRSLKENLESQRGTRTPMGDLFGI